MKPTRIPLAHARNPTSETTKETKARKGRCGHGGIGRRASLRCLWGNTPWKFESSWPHQASKRDAADRRDRKNGKRGRSSMVEQKPSKLTTRVRFPSPAPFPSSLRRSRASRFRARGVRDRVEAKTRRRGSIPRRRGSIPRRRVRTIPKGKNKADVRRRPEGDRERPAARPDLTSETNRENDGARKHPGTSLRKLPEEVVPRRLGRPGLSDRETRVPRPDGRGRTIHQIE